MSCIQRAICITALMSLTFAGLSLADEASDEALLRISQALGVPADHVDLQEARTAAHLEAYPFSATCEGYRVRGLYAKALRQIVQASFDYGDDFEPDPRWAGLQPNEAMTVHLRSLNMALPKGVRLAKQRELPMGNWGKRVSLLYERVGGDLAPLWLSADLNAADHRPYELTSIDYPLEVDTTPSVPEPAAVATARGATGIDAKQTYSARLRVWFGDNHEQVLWWDISFVQADRSDLIAKVTIDAHSGEVVRKAFYEGDQE